MIQTVESVQREGSRVAMLFTLLLGAALSCAQGPSTVNDPSAIDANGPAPVGLPAWVKQIGSSADDPANASPTALQTSFNNVNGEPPAPVQVQVSVGLSLPE